MKLWWVIPVVVASATGPARADAPAWCKGKKLEYTSITNGNGEFLFKTDADDEKTDAFQNVVAALCTPKAGSDNGEAALKYRNELETARQRWAKRFAMTEEDFGDAAEWASAGVGERRGLRIEVDLDKKAWSSLGPVEQFAELTRGSGPSGSAMLDWLYVADALGAKITQAGRLGFISHCIDGNSKAVEWAMCQGDIAALDMAKLNAELRADKAAGGFEKMTIRMIADDYIRHRLPAHAADVKKLTGKDPAYGKLFELADKTRKDWDGLYKTDAALLDLAAAMDDANATKSRHALEGCDDKTWKAWQTAVAAIPAKTFAGMHDDLENMNFMYPRALAAVLTNVEAYNAAVAYTLCHSDDKGFFSKMLSIGLSRWPGERGPRNATVVAAMRAGIELDDRDAKLDFPDPYRTWFGPLDGGHSGGGFGAVSKVKADAKKTHLEFAPVPVKQDQCTKEVTTHRIEMIRDNGDVVYERQCLASKIVTVNHASQPTDVDARFATGLKGGMVVSVIEGVLLAAWPTNGAKQPSIIFGVAVK